MGAHLLDQIEISAYLNPDATPAQSGVDSSPADAQIRASLRSSSFRRSRVWPSCAQRTKGRDRHRAAHREPAAGQVPHQGARSRRRAGRRRRAFGACRAFDNVVYGQTVVAAPAAARAPCCDASASASSSSSSPSPASSSRIRSGLPSSRGAARSRSCSWSARRTLHSHAVHLRRPARRPVGALFAVGVLAIARATLWPRLLEALPWLALNAVAVDPLVLVAELFLVGGAVGVVASWISVGRHLRT